MDGIIQSFVSLLQDKIPEEMVVFVISLFPVLELRGGLIAASLMDIEWWRAFIFCFLGNMLPMPFIFFFARKVLEWGADKPVIGKFFSFCLNKGRSGGE